MAKETSKKKKGGVKSWLVKLAVGGVAVYLLTTLVSGRLQVARMQQELDEVQVKADQQEVVNDELQEMLDSGDEDAYIERIAREKLGYARPEETIFVDMSSE